MKISKFILIHPGDHWGDLPQGIAPPTAANLLACWTALWHPQLLIATGRLPTSASLQELDGEGPTAGSCVVLPSIVPNSDIPQPSESPTTDEVPSVVCHLEQGESRAEIWPQLEPHLGESLDPTCPGIGQLAGLGFAHLQVEMLTRAMHYDGLLRWDPFESAAVEAAKAAVEGDTERMASRLDDAYDLLMQARNHYYPVDFYLVDIGLVAPTICGPEFAAACRKAKGANFLVTGDTLRDMAREAPQSLEALKQAIADERASVCGGSQTARPLAAMTPEELLADLRAGLATCEELLETRPSVFAHHSGPIAPVMPGVLYRLGYYGVIQSNFAGHRSPHTLHNRTAWCGPDGVHIEAVNAVPIDAGSATALLELAVTTGRSMDYELAATILLAGWPGYRTEAYDDLCEVAGRSSLLGKMVRLDDYFEQTTSYDHAGPLDFDEYPGPPLGTPLGTAAQPQATASTPSKRFAHLAQLAGGFGESNSGTPLGTADLVRLVGATPEPAEPGVLMLNASSFQRRAPGFGWKWVTPGETLPLVGDAARLVNGMMELHIHPETGGISALRLHNRRGNVLSQRLVLLPPIEKGYAIHDENQIALDKIEQGPGDGDRLSVVAHSRVVDRQGNALAHLRQTTSLDRYSPRVVVEIEGEMVNGTAQPADGGVWLVANQLAVREEVPLRRGVQGMALPTKRSRFVAPWFQFASETVPITIVADRARRHFQHHEQRVDTLLVDEPVARFEARLSFWLESRYPAHAAWEENFRDELAFLHSSRPAQTEGWWLSLGARNVVATHFAMEQLGDVPILRLRIMETEGRTADVHLACWRPFTEAQQVDFRGQAERLLTVKEGVVHLSLAPYEWVELVAAWEG